MRKLAYPDNSNFETAAGPVKYPDTSNSETAADSVEYRIVAKRRGDCVIGYHIRQDNGHTIRYRGAMVHTLKAARELREFYRRNDGTAHTSFEVIE